MRRILAIAWLTWKAALRFRLFLVVLVLLLAAVVALPVLIKDDGTAQGFTQILMTYTLTAVTALLGLSTLWVSCGTLARDIEECQMQVVAVKPIGRWQIWLGKWLGVMSLNAVLLALAGGSIFSLVLWRASRLPADEQKTLRNEVLVARGSVKPPRMDKDIDEETDRRLKERLDKVRLDGVNLKDARKQLREQVKSEAEVVPNSYTRVWELELGLARYKAADKPLQVRFKFNTADLLNMGTYDGVWLVGKPGKTKYWRSEVMSLAPDTFHEFQVPPNLFDENGTLTIQFFNPNAMALLFPTDDGMEVLYPEGGFGLNYLRGLGIIFCWMALLSALGLATASFLSFPVAAFLSLGILGIVLTSGTMANAVSEGTIADYNAEKGTKGWSPADVVVIPAFKGILQLIALAKDFSPIDALSTGRSIGWEQLGLAFGQVVLLLGGALAVFGIFVFTRRELATAQGTQ
jgi:hypothetical protein